MLKKIDHLGIAVKSLEEMIPFYEKVMGMKCVGTEEVESQKVKTAFFEIGDTHIELLEPTSEDSAVAKFMAKNGEGIHHIAYYSEDIEADLAKAKAEGCRLIHETPIPGAHGKKVAFLHPKSTHGVLTEFCTCGEEH